uniref:Integrase, catalytic region, zinc finger, CCHC-type, peptidase aspartic, catalytic n=1 Tax=Tanacetum cinerariifolium TaxID=118510 RepID=A0A699HAC2_TANCI|nr:integrase, catalytic region, zinc finger, CCHC-type, peptidase aspartic, catalytic [Tanacetum cinerariifolium]
MDLCGPMRIASINGKRYILVIVDDYSRYTWVHFLRSKDEAPAVIIMFLKRITAEAIATACFTQNRSIIHHRFNKTPYELLNGRKLDISFLHVFGALCYPKNDREDIGKLGAKGVTQSPHPKRQKFHTLGWSFVASHLFVKPCLDDCTNSKVASIAHDLKGHIPAMSN